MLPMAAARVVMADDQRIENDQTAQAQLLGLSRIWAETTREALDDEGPLLVLDAQACAVTERGESDPTTIRSSEDHALALVKTVELVIQIGRPKAFGRKRARGTDVLAVLSRGEVCLPRPPRFPANDAVAGEAVAGVLLGRHTSWIVADPVESKDNGESPDLKCTRARARACAPRLSGQRRGCPIDSVRQTGEATPLAGLAVCRTSWDEVPDQERGGFFCV